jgi:hypothetical protein
VTHFTLHKCIQKNPGMLRCIEGERRTLCGGWGSGATGAAAAGVNTKLLAAGLNVNGLAEADRRDGVAAAMATHERCDGLAGCCWPRVAQWGRRGGTGVCEWEKCVRCVPPDGSDLCVPLHTCVLTVEQWREDSSSSSEHTANGSDGQRDYYSSARFGQKEARKLETDAFMV